VAINNSKQSSKYTHQQLSHGKRKTVMQYKDSIKALFIFGSSYGVNYRHEWKFVNTYGRSMVCHAMNFRELGNSKRHYVLIP
jgi:hypothetical protein